MKKLSLSFKEIGFIFMLTIISAMASAQDSAATSSTTSSSTQITTETTTSFVEPWVWVVGAAILIIIIVALTRGSGTRSSGTTDKVTYTKHVSREDDV